MPAYKDPKTNKWMSNFRYKNWKGENKRCVKRGFATKREALEYEHAFKASKTNDPDMHFDYFVGAYKEDVYSRIKKSTALTKDLIIDKYILPYFKNKRLSDITTKDILQWQNEVMKLEGTNGEKLSKSYLKTIHNQMSAILSHAIKYYGLHINVAAIVGNMGTDAEVKTGFWSVEEYMKVRDELMENPRAFYAIETLFWTGMRVGELLALTPADVDFEAGLIHISKTFNVIKGEEVISSPKTQSSDREITIPVFLQEELGDYMSMLYKQQEDERLFDTRRNILGRKLKQAAGDAGVTPIRIHDLRHSHVSLLIQQGWSPVAIAKRVGHSKTEITLNRYAHMYPSVAGGIADSLDVCMKGLTGDGGKGNVN